MPVAAYVFSAKRSVIADEVALDRLAATADLVVLSADGDPDAATTRAARLRPSHGDHPPAVALRRSLAMSHCCGIAAICCTR